MKRYYITGVNIKVSPVMAHIEFLENLNNDLNIEPEVAIAMDIPTLMQLKEIIEQTLVKWTEQQTSFKAERDKMTH